MTTSKMKFLELVSDNKSDLLKDVKERIHNRSMLKESQQIALKVLSKLDELGWSQKILADKMGVTPQQVNKIVRGKENLTLETMVSLQSNLNIPLLASQYEALYKKYEEIILTYETFEKYSVGNVNSNDYISGQVLKVEVEQISNIASYKKAS